MPTYFRAAGLRAAKCLRQSRAGAETLRVVARGELAPTLLRAACRALPLRTPEFEYAMGLVERPQYAYGVRTAATLARSLGHPGMTVIEFGVAGGNGLRALEGHALHYAEKMGLEIDVIGFDGGKGLPPPVDHRDLPYLWQEGFFLMDEELLRRSLRRAELVIGDVATTVAAFVAARPQLAERPIGFVVFDLDYYSSTANALSLFAGSSPPTSLLPRVTCFFDDVIYKIESVGQMLAIREFNGRFADRSIGHPFGLRDSLPFRPAWSDRIFEAHFFGHPEYGTLVSQKSQLPLAQRNTPGAGVHPPAAKAEVRPERTDRLS